MYSDELLRQLNVAKIGGKTALITPIITTSAAAYTSGDCVGGAIKIADAVRELNGTAILKSIFVRDSQNQKSDLTILIFNSNPTGSTTTDNSAFVYGTSLSQQIAKINVAASDYETINSIATADIDIITKIVQTNTGLDLYMVVVTTGTPTYGVSSSVLSISLGFLQD